jgi:hypothetical protein
MTEKKIKRDGQGTFAQLYDVQEQLSQRDVKPLGRPRKKIQRKPTTIHLTQLESRTLSELHLLVNDKFSINRSELVGVAIDALSILIENEAMETLEKARIQDVKSFRELICDFVKS